MHGPRQFTRTHLLALAALMLLPACSPRQPIPSDPPEVRTEASVRGARKGPAQEQRAPKTSPVTSDPSDVVVAEVRDEQPSSALLEKKPAQAKAQAAQEAKAETRPAAAAAPQASTDKANTTGAQPTDAKPADAKPVDAKAIPAAGPEAKPAEAVQEAKAPEAKAPEAKAPGDKPGEAKPAVAAPEAKTPEAKTSEAKTIGTKPEPSAEAKADAAAQAAKSEPAQAGPQPAPRVPLVQIASFTTEKNAEAAVAWLKEKGYSQTRVVRVEQGGTAFHRVQAGPFQDPAAAREALEKLKADWPQAFIPAD
ncbi:MAG: SPOR domain-containing protein [Desulfovibrio sp.]|jgi:cell division septation protein DedD|nr:SPOR domain-containing protein [Desulfovibrio sp.]